VILLHQNAGFSECAMPPAMAAPAADRAFGERFHQWDWRRETGMVFRQTIWRRKRSAEDPEYRKKERERLRAYWAAHKKLERDTQASPAETAQIQLQQ
jgi:hypothetical protein